MDSNKSLAQQLAELPPEERERALEGFDQQALLHDWNFWARPNQMEPSEDWWSVWAVVAGRGFGKPLEASTPIPTPDGWKKIGELTPGDQVFAHDGTPTKVTHVYRPSDHKAARVTFSDGSEIVAGLTHEWTVLDHKDKSLYRTEHDPREFNHNWWKWTPAEKTRGPKHILPTNDIIARTIELRAADTSWRSVQRILETEFPDARPSQVSRKRLAQIFDSSHEFVGKVYSNTRCAKTITTLDLKPGSHSVFNAAPLNTPHIDLPIDPYILGLWLGDGSTRDGCLCGHVDDVPEYVEQFVARGYDDVAHRIDKRNPNLIVFSSKKLRAQLKSARLLGHKHVPAVYLRASIAQRLDLLRGMMDTDGSINKHGINAGVGFVKEELATAAYELATSLGYIARRNVRMLDATPTRPVRPFHIVDFRPNPDVNPFLLTRKARRVTAVPVKQAFRKTARMITSVEYVGERDLVCIAVDAESRLFLAGESMIPTHNTRLGAEWVREKAKTPNTRIALVARTAADARDVMVEGESGILNIDPLLTRDAYAPSNRRITWPNGSIATTFSADTPDQTRGPQFHFAWADEMAAWNHIPGVDGATAWDNVQIATRLRPHDPNERNKIIATTTPKRLPAMTDLLAREGDDTIVTRGSTFDNAGNLPDHYLKFINALYKGTRLEQQELHGILLDDVEGALWALDKIDQFRVKALPIGLPYKVIAVDPSVAENPRDECGIIVAGATGHSSIVNRHTFIIEDRTVHGSPAEWAKEVIAAYQKWQCPVVVEINQGGALVKDTIHGLNPDIPVIEVRAYQGKAVRAEPVYLKYDQGKVHHLGYLGTLESQMTSWVPGETKKSPDRVDALVYAVTALAVKPPREMNQSRLRMRANHETLPGVKKLGKNLTKKIHIQNNRGR